MIDNNKRLGIFIVVTAAVLLLAMGLFTYFFNKQQNPTTTPTATTTATDEANKLLEEAKNNQPAVNYTYDANAEDNRALTAEDVRKIAMSFTERFGSFSNQASYDNFTDLKIFMTKKMNQWADNYVAQLKKADTDRTSYYGITTTAVSAKVTKFSDTTGQAEVLVTTQRREVSAAGGTKNFNQDLLLNFVKVQNEWLVDGAFWQK
jgi:hypothetical protein